MDKDQLRLRLMSLQKEAYGFSIEKFPKIADQPGLVEASLPEWDVWVGRVLGCTPRVRQ